MHLSFLYNNFKYAHNVYEREVRYGRNSKKIK